MCTHNHTHAFMYTPVAKAEMLIRKPVEQVFDAFIDPAITTKFWFTKSSGKLEDGKQIQWDWEMHQASAQVRVLALSQNKRILLEWPVNGTPTKLEFLFAPQPNETTFVSIMNTGFEGDADEIVEQVVDSTEGFALVLAGLKAYLEHNILLNLVADRFPKH